MPSVTPYLLALLQLPQHSLQLLLGAVCLISGSRSVCAQRGHLLAQLGRLLLLLLASLAKLLQLAAGRDEGCLQLQAGREAGRKGNGQAGMEGSREAGRQAGREAS